METIDRLLNNNVFASALAQSDYNPILFVGDFNSPSHLDWIKSTKHLHCNWVVPWPVTKKLVDDAQLIDSYREIYPDPLVYPG